MENESVMVSSVSQGGEQCDIISIPFHTVSSVCAAPCVQQQEAGLGCSWLECNGCGLEQSLPFIIQ